jgi:hypothetical protein
MSAVALQITLPASLGQSEETYLYSALQDLGTEPESGSLWHFKGSIGPDEFRRRLRKGLPMCPELAEKVGIEILRRK